MLQFPTWKKALIGLVCLFGILYAAPNFLPRGSLDALSESTAGSGLLSLLPTKQLALGLDLRGGAHLLMRVETDAVVAERLEATEDSIRRELRAAKARAQNLRVAGTRVLFTLRTKDKVDDIRDRIRRMDAEATINVSENADFEVSFTEQVLQQIRENALEQSVEIVRRRVDQFGTTEPTIQRQGVDRILVQVPGIDDTKRLKELIGKTAKLSFHLVDREKSVADALNTGRVPPGLRLLPSQEKRADGSPEQHYLISKRVIVSGENLTNAQATFQDAQPVVAFSFDARGGTAFGRATGENVGELLAISLDGEIISAPRINEPILGGNGIISGNFTLRTAEDLALLLRAGALPAPLTPIEERTVGPGLGQDSIDAGSMASVIGFVLVVAFMIASYGRFGAMADVALVMNLALIIAILSAIGATLTLPGIAGIVLTVGMAVDANVLIFERIREEAAVGRTPINAVEAGYKRALTTIIDSNLTTLIAATLLFAFGSGPIRGFAVTLSIGIMTSMFTAFMVTRYLVVTWLRTKRPKSLPI